VPIKAGSLQKEQTNYTQIKHKNDVNKGEMWKMRGDVPGDCPWGTSQDLMRTL